MKRIPRRLFAEEFKREAIKFVIERRMNAVAASRQRDIATKPIRAWIEKVEGVIQSQFCCCFVSNSAKCHTLNHVSKIRSDFTISSG